MFVHAGNRAIITTYSPYILGEFNNLIYANEIQGVDEKRNTIVDSEKILPYDDSRAFYVADGFVKDAMEDHLIINSLINGASDEINAGQAYRTEMKVITSKKRSARKINPRTPDFENYLKSSRRASTACLCMSGRTWL